MDATRTTPLCVPSMDAREIHFLHIDIFVCPCDDFCSGCSGWPNILSRDQTMGDYELLESCRTDIVERLRNEGKDAFTRKYSLGMFLLCTEAADEIERLRNILAQARTCRCLACNTDGFQHSPECAVHSGTRNQIGPCDCVTTTVSNGERRVS